MECNFDEEDFEMINEVPLHVTESKLGKCRNQSRAMSKRLRKEKKRQRKFEDKMVNEKEKRESMEQCWKDIEAEKLDIEDRIQRAYKTGGSYIEMLKGVAEKRIAKVLEEEKEIEKLKIELEKEEKELREEEKVKRGLIDTLTLYQTSN